jgi:hypothetical protein
MMRGVEFYPKFMIDLKMGSVRRGVFKAFAQTGAAVISSFPN